MDRTATTEPSTRPSTSFHDLDELLLGPTDLEAMPFEFSCDFASAFEDKHISVDAPAPSHRSTSRPKEAKRSHKRKSDSLASSSLQPRALPALALPAELDANERDDLGAACEPAEAHAHGGSTQIGRWTKKEHEQFLEGLRLYGKSWKKISSLVVTRTLVQIRTHAQKYLQKQTKSAMKAAAAAAAAAAGTATTVPTKSRKAVPRMGESQALWKQQPHSHASVFLPIAFPEHVAGSSSSSSSSSCSSSSSFSGSALISSSSYKELGAHSISAMSKLDQLLHDDSTHTVSSGHDDYYSSPTGTDDELAQWLQHRHLPYVSSPATKRRRTDVGTSSATSSWAMVNPLEASMAAHNGNGTHTSYYSSHGHNHGHRSSAGSSDYLPPLSAYANHSDSEFTFNNSWL